MSLTDTIGRFSTAAADNNPSGYVITRGAAGAMSSQGEWVAGTTSTFTIDACIQPGQGKRIEPLPEGVNVDDVIEIDTSTALQVAPVPDHINYNSTDYTIYRVDGPRNLDGGANYTAYAARQRKLP